MKRNCDQESCILDIDPVSVVAPYDVSKIILRIADDMNDSDKVQFLNNCWRPNGGSHADLYTHCFGKNKEITFHMKWPDQRPWLAYSAHPEHKGGWCKTCLLFLNDKEKESLGVFDSISKQQIKRKAGWSLIHRVSQESSRPFILGRSTSGKYRKAH